MPDQRKVNRPAPRRDERRAELARIHALMLDKTCKSEQLDAEAAKLAREKRLPALASLIQLEAERRR